jgi:putrescine transport system permease protein
MKPGKVSAWAGTAFLALVFLFLYGPILSVICYSFNASKLATVWSHFSLQWYAQLAQDDELMQAAWVSLRLALFTAFASMVMGGWAGFVLAQFRNFRGFSLFTAMINAPMVLPEVISGISLLLLFVTLEQTTGWPNGRGMLTIWIGHVMLCLSYVAITVQARLATMDASLTEAARDLGAPPWRVFFDITLPLISQALVSGWLLSFTISLDDVVMSAFLSGPGTTPLPLVVLSRVRIGLNPEINALGTLFIVFVGVIVIGNNHLLMRRERRRERDLQLAMAGARPEAAAAIALRTYTAAPQPTAALPLP